MSKHTKGPWTWREGFYGLDGEESDILTHAPYEGMYLSYHRNDYEREANARLIAAAPELLEALESLVLFTKPTKSNAVALNNAHNIIAKARGEA